LRAAICRTFSFSEPPMATQPAQALGGRLVGALLVGIAVVGGWGLSGMGKTG
jgi:hypothetical protein